MTIKQTNGNTLSYRMDQVEKAVDKLDTKLDVVLENHLPHLKEQIIGLSTQIKVFTAINLIGIILGIIAARVFK